LIACHITSVAASRSLACRPSAVGRNETRKSPFDHFSTVISATYWLAPQKGAPSGRTAVPGLADGVVEGVGGAVREGPAADDSVDVAGPQAEATATVSAANAAVRTLTSLTVDRHRTARA
jgi:hypothetical protein